MGFLPTFNGVKIEIIYRFNGELVVNIYWLVAATGGAASASDLNALNIVMNTWRTNYLRALQSTGMVVQMLRATDQTDPAGAEDVFTPGVSLAGTSINQPLPGNAAACVTLHTAKRGRRFTGRSYLGGLTTAQIINGNQLQATFVTAAGAAYQNLINTLVAGTRFRYGVRSEKNIYAPLLPPVNYATIEPIVDISMDNNVDSQRRRLAGRGS